MIFLFLKSICTGKNILYLLAAIAIGVVGWKINSFIEDKAKLEAQVVSVKKDLDTSQQNFKLAQDAAVSNKAALDEMVAQQVKTDAINVQLNKQIVAANTFSQKLVNKISNIKPEQDGKISTVLADTIRAIQEQPK